LGNRFQNIANALALLTGDKEETNAFQNVTMRVLHTSMLHETAPMYVTDQPSFLNGVVELETNLTPNELLLHLKTVEAQIGRDLQGGIRNGPRPVDLDILFYGQASKEDPSSLEHLVMDTPDLVIPHPRIQEREFVLAPLCEVARFTPQPVKTSRDVTPTRYLVHPVLNQSVSQLLTDLLQNAEMTTPPSDKGPPQRVLVVPLPRNRLLRLGKETVLMGVLNVTPDSFSDGGKWSESLDAAVQHALNMEQDGAGIIDIGGESTRPGAKEVPIDEELARTIPVIQRIRRGKNHVVYSSTMLQR
jgi:2-amino-4-hydroxy-6-hydroxymethyldihydropteridine diphosphokinase